MFYEGSQMGKKNNPNIVTKDFCDERFGRIIDKLDTIDGKVGTLDTKVGQARSEIGYVKTEVTKLKNGVESRWQPKYYVPVIVSFIALLGTVISQIPRFW